MAPIPPPPRKLHWLQAGLVGLPLVLLGLVLLTGSAEAALNLIVLSTVCTLGIGGLFWFGIAAVLGYAVLAVWRAVQHKPAPGNGKAEAQQLISTYVQSRLQEGGDAERIRADLQRTGWRPAEINAAFASGLNSGVASGGEL
jgi:hypothetical protein